jgi:hypothetical protein
MFLKLSDSKCVLNLFASLLHLHTVFNLKIDAQLSSVIMIFKDTLNFVIVGIIIMFLCKISSFFTGLFNNGVSTA